MVDTGIGIHPDHMDHLTEPFYQVDSSSTRPYGGSGVGLTLASSFIHLLNGELLCGSRLGWGSVFAVVLPLPHVPDGAAQDSDGEAHGLGAAGQVPAPLRSGTAFGLAKTAAQSDGSDALGQTSATVGSASRKSEIMVTVRPAAPPSPPSQIRTRASSSASRLALAPATSNAATARTATLPVMALTGGLPIDSRGALVKPSSPPPPRRGAVLSRPVALIVDDNPLNVLVLERQLSHLGFDTVSASNGLESVQRVEQYLASAAQPQGTPSSRTRLRRAVADLGGRSDARLDVIFMDLHMPVMDGVAATIAIRERERAANRGTSPVPIVAISADDPTAQLAACLAAGMSRYIRKPLVLNELLALVRELELV